MSAEHGDGSSVRSGRRKVDLPTEPLTGREAFRGQVAAIMAPPEARFGATFAELYRDDETPNKDTGIPLKSSYPGEGEASYQVFSENRRLFRPRRETIIPESLSFALSPDEPIGYDVKLDFAQKPGIYGRISNITLRAPMGRKLDESPFFSSLHPYLSETHSVHVELPVLPDDVATLSFSRKGRPNRRGVISNRNSYTTVYTLCDDGQNLNLTGVSWRDNDRIPEDILPYSIKHPRDRRKEDILPARSLVDFVSDLAPHLKVDTGNWKSMQEWEEESFVDGTFIPWQPSEEI